MLIDFRMMGRTLEEMSPFGLVKRVNSCRVFEELEADQDIDCIDSRMAMLKGTTAQRRIHSGILQKRCRVSATSHAGRRPAPDRSRVAGYNEHDTVRRHCN